MAKKQHSVPSEGPFAFSPLLAAVRLAGGVSAVAEMLQVQRMTVYGWLHRGRLVNDKTIEYARALHEKTGIKIESIICGLEVADGDGKGRAD